MNILKASEPQDIPGLHFGFDAPDVQGLCIATEPCRTFDELHEPRRGLSPGASPAHSRMERHSKVKARLHLLGVVGNQGNHPIENAELQNCLITLEGSGIRGLGNTPISR